MEHRWKKILGQMQPVKPGSVDTYLSDYMGVFIPREPMDFSKPDHVHQGYEFVVPFGCVPSYPYRVEEKVVIMESRKVFPFNPEQSHRAVDRSFSHELLAVFFDTGFLQGLAESMQGITAIHFANLNFVYDSYLKGLLCLFMEESKYRQGGYDLITQSIATQVGVHFIRRAKSNCPSSENEKIYSERKGVKQAVEFIHENYCHNFSLNQLAQIAHLSPYHFSKVFKTEVGQPPFEYLLDVKIAKAKELLRFSDKPVTEVCFESGFNNISHFSRIFTRKVGVAPTVFRKTLL